MSRWTSSKQSVNKKPSVSKSGRPGTSKLDTSDYDNDCPIYEADHLNSNDLGPKDVGGLGNAFLTFSSAFKPDHGNTRARHASQRKDKTRTKSESHKITLEVETHEELSEESKRLLCSYIYRDIIGCDLIFSGPFGNNIVTYLDYVASGRPLKCIEQYIRQYVMPAYSNTHTEVNYVAQQTTRLREEAREIIRECVNANDDDVVIFTGSGATAAINKLIHAMNIRSPVADLSPIVFVGPYEHHSNILPWREIATKVVTIHQTEHGLLDLDNLTAQLQLHTKCTCNTKHLLIGTFSAASNVTGILTDVNLAAALMHKYGGYAFFDYACAAPYTNIDMNPPDLNAYKDAIFISPHKFIGGPQTPGVLVAKRWVFKNPVPHGVGGGTVVFVRRMAHIYSSHLEHREEGGTPAIMESVRAGLVFKLKAAFTTQFIMSRERDLFTKAKTAWSKLPNLLILGNMNVDRLPIFPMLFLNPDTGRFLHHDFVAKILNDVFGIQVRSGCACAGPYGMDLLGMKEKVGEIFEKMITVKPKQSEIGQTTCIRSRNVIFKPGFVRLNFPYFIPDDCLHFVLKAVQMTSEKGWTLLPLYSYERDSGRWWYRLKKDFYLKSSLNDITFTTGKFSIKKSGQPLEPSADNMEMDDMSTMAGVSESCTYDEILERAELIFSEAETPHVFDVSDTSKDFTVEDDALRWFMLPCEAASIINNRQVRHLGPEDLPFLPQAFKEKLYSSGWK